MKALVSVYDRTGAVEFAGKLVEAGFEIISTGGTRGELTAAGLPVTLLSDVTGFPEILDGRVKTLHPVIHAGILARRDLDSHVAELSERGIDGIDVVVGNLYPFVETIRKPGVTLEDALENIDIGGPTMIRAAAKNFPSVIVIVDPNDYGWVGERIRQANALTLEERKGLALKAFRHVAQYDAAVSRYLSDGDIVSGSEFAVGFEKIADMRYGENPSSEGVGVPRSAGVGGDRKRGAAARHRDVLHQLPRRRGGVVGRDRFFRGGCVYCQAPESLRTIRARRPADGVPKGAGGRSRVGIRGHRRVQPDADRRDRQAAMRGVLYHVIVAPDYEPEALDILKRRKETRILKVNSTGGDLSGFDLRLVSGGALLQTADAIEEDPASWKVVTERQPTERELADLAFAWRVCKHIKSNAIVLGKDNTLVGMGTGSRTASRASGSPSRQRATRSRVARWRPTPSCRSPTTSRPPLRRGLLR